MTAADVDLGEIAALKAFLGARPRPEGWPARRTRMEEVTADALPEGVAITGAALGGRPAAWADTADADRTRATLYLHGGGYCSGSLTTHRALTARIPGATGARAVALDYRLAPEHPFPTALDDALAAWDALRAEGFAAADLALAGDSAGAGLALATMLRLRERGERPACAWLISPWVDLSMTGLSMDAKVAVDPLINRAYLEGLASAYLGGHDAADPLASPLGADLAGLPPTLIQVGSAETLLDDAVRLAGRLGAADVDVRREVVPHMIHAFPVWAGRLTGGRAVIARAGPFIREQFERSLR